ncbi:MFS transporter [Adlercreutzia sp. ZJ304]|uniref:MFS transporter n=1 Tax=Adlercreutzia sp. ZJ304 TaxID=2709791 RepID=UPI0013EABC99|nr:MFS transporter [Adlercreutzia sp. ZJ304]
MTNDAVVSANQKTPARAWAVLVVVYIASFMAPMAQFKVPALENWIIPELIIPQFGPENISLYFGIMMSALAIIGVILAFPAAIITRKFGMKASMVISVAALMLGTLVCVVGDNYWMVLVGRMIEGVGIGLVGVVAPACVSIWFPEKTRGTALGIWASWFPLGITVMFNIAPMIATVADWQGVYWFCIVCDIVALILFLLVFKMPEYSSDTPPEEASLKDGWKYLKNSKLWILAVVFFIYNFIQLGVVNSFYNQFLSSVGGLDPQAANGITSVMTAIGIISLPLGGVIFDRVPYKHKNKLMILTYVLWIIALLFAFGSGNDMMVGVWIFIIVMGIANGFGAGSLRPYAPSLVPNTALGATMAMALLQFMQNLGSAVGSPVYGAVLDSVGWVNANYFLLIPMCVIAIVLACFLKPKNSDKTISAANDTEVN